MSDDAIASYSVKGLEQLLKALKAKPPACHVGILGNKNARDPKQNSKSKATNAEIGAVWEFSLTHPRSFLRVPIADGLEKEMNKSGLFDARTFAEVVKTGSIIPWMKQVASCAEACVSDAFETGGNGKWAAWTTPGYTNNTGQVLIDTHQLRDSVTSEVKA